MPKQPTCSHCSRPLTKTAVLSPTLDKQRREQCVECGGGWVNDWEEKFKNKFEDNLGYFREHTGFRMLTLDIIKFIHRLLAQARTEAVAEYRKEVMEAIEGMKQEMHCRMNKYDMNNGCPVCEKIHTHNQTLSDLKTKLNNLGKE